MKKLLGLLGAVVFSVMSLTVSAESSDDFLVETYDMTTGTITTENLGNVDDTDYFPSTKVANNVYTQGARTIIGDDDRAIVKDTTVRPYSCIGYLRGVRTDGAIIKRTAFLVGPSKILTAASNVYPEFEFKEYRFYPGYNSLEKDTGNEAPYAYANAIVTKIHIPADFKKAYNANDLTNKEKYDYALIELDKPIGTSAGWLPLAGYNTAYNENTLVGKNVVIVGYPRATNHYMYRDKKPILSFPNNYLIATTADGDIGQEGGPMLIAANNTYYALGIYNIYGDYAQNRGRYITKKIYELVNKY